MKRLPVHVRAYTAGFIDGEGSISLVRHNCRQTKSGRPNTSPKLLLQVSNTNRAIVEWLCETWDAGTIVVSYRPTRPEHRQAFAWRVRGEKAAVLLKAILPYLRIKRAQAELGIHAQSLIVSSKKLGDAEMAERFALRDQMLALNVRGHK